jgi:hypothetical protein
MSSGRFKELPMGRLACLVILLALGSIASAQATPRDPRQVPFKGAMMATPDAQEPVVEYVGQASMEDDGTIVLQMHRTGDGIFVSAPPFRYPKSHPKYQYILDHLGPMHPGEHRLVKPFPD